MESACREDQAHNTWDRAAVIITMLLLPMTWWHKSHTLWLRLIFLTKHKAEPERIRTEKRGKVGGVWSYPTILVNLCHLPIFWGLNLCHYPFKIGGKAGFTEPFLQAQHWNKHLLLFYKRVILFSLVFFP